MADDHETPVLTYGLRPRQPAFALPPLACDAHVHVFGPAARFPFAATRHITPADAPKEALFALHRRLGIARCVIVQSAIHGFDNTVVEDAIEAGGGLYLGVAVVPPGVTDGELQRLASRGFRAVRFNFMAHLSMGAGVQDVVALSPRLACVGMHLQVHCESKLLHTLAEPLARSVVPVVIDHMGRVDAELGCEHPDFQALLALLRNPLFRVKVSGVDRIDARPREGTRYEAGVALARLLVERYPEQCLWGTDWPHPNHTHVPDDATLVEVLAQIAPTPALLQQLLVSNPQSFYRFET